MELMECGTVFYAFEVQMYYVRGYAVKGWAALKLVCVPIRWQREVYIVCQYKYAYVCSYVCVLLMLHSCVAIQTYVYPYYSVLHHT